MWRLRPVESISGKWNRSRSLLLLLVILPIDEFRHPKPGIDDVEIYSAFVWLGAPRERRIGPEAFQIAGPKATDFASLTIQVSTKLTRNVQRAGSAAVITDVHDVILDPHVVGPLFGNFVLGDLFWI